MLQGKMHFQQLQAHSAANWSHDAGAALEQSEYLLLSDWRLLKRRAWSECSFRSFATSSPLDPSTSNLVALGSVAWSRSTLGEGVDQPPFCTWRACEDARAQEEELKIHEPERVSVNPDFNTI